jgi:hypothetical protein
MDTEEKTPRTYRGASLALPLGRGLDDSRITPRGMRARVFGKNRRASPDATYLSVATGGSMM